jgi:hypothetical protein
VRSPARESAAPIPQAVPPDPPIAFPERTFFRQQNKISRTHLLFIGAAFRAGGDKVMILDVAIIEQFCLFDFVASLLGQGQRELAVKLLVARHHVSSNIVILASLHIQFDDRRLVVRADGMLSGIELHDEEAANRNLCELAARPPRPHEARSRGEARSGDSLGVSI